MTLLRTHPRHLTWLPGLTALAASLSVVTVMALAPVTDEPVPIVNTVKVADLKTWLHGEPKLPPKAAPPAQLAQVSRAKGVPADAPVEDFLRAMAAAIKARDGNAMLPRLSERYSVDDVPSGAKPGDFFAQAIDRMPGPLEIVLLGISSEREVRLARIELRYSNDRISSKTLRFDSAGQLLGSDLFVLKRQSAFG